MRLPVAILGYCRDRADIQAVIDAATELAEWQVRRGYAPLWWHGRARYTREVHDGLPGVERVNLPEEVEALGADDCDGHAPYLCASLRAVGVPSRALVIRSPGIGYHVVVGARTRDGRTIILDPSARRGMLDMPDREVGASMRARRRRSDALRRAARLIRHIERMAPGSRARTGLAVEVERLLEVARAAEREGGE